MAVQESEEPGVGIVLGIGRNPTKRLSEYWDDALAAAANSLDPGQEPGEFTVKTHVFVEKNSPGFVDGFRVSLH
jgi:hypothetical protein